MAFEPLDDVGVARVLEAPPVDRERERACLARQLHDVLGEVCIITAQATGALRGIGESADHAAAALQVIESAGRVALSDLRHLLDALRDEREAGEVPYGDPGTNRLFKLLARVRDAGLRTSFQVEGDPRSLTAETDLFAYRIVHEALMNAMKHAAGAPADVRLRYSERELEIRVVNETRGVANGDLSTGGRGLVGIRERVELAGGSLWAGATPGGVFLVDARLPI
jgi:signal transduction histidine kinase